MRARGQSSGEGQEGLEFRKDLGVASKGWGGESFGEACEGLGGSDLARAGGPSSSESFRPEFWRGLGVLEVRRGGKASAGNKSSGKGQGGWSSGKCW